MFEGSEKKISRNGIISYWENGIILGKSCSKCGEIKKIDEFAFHNKKLKTYQTQCKECDKKYRKKNKETLKELGKRWRENNSEYHKHYREENKEHYNEWYKQYYQKNKEYYKQHYKDNQEHYKQYYENNKEHLKEKSKQYYLSNKTHVQEWSKQYYLDNQEHVKEYNKQYREENKEHYREWQKQRYESDKNNNIAEITQMLHQLSPIFETLNLKAYGRIYKITNIKTNRIYIGQTILPLDVRYGTNVIKGWIENRKKFKNQKFLEELNNEEDFIIETINFGCCKYHLDKLEALYIDKYDSCNNGYNNNYGNYNTDDGIDEFNKILEENKLVFKNGELQLIE